MPESPGLLAEFDAPQPLIEASLHAWAMGYRQLDAFAPFPLESLQVLFKSKASRVPRMACIGALLGIVLALLMQIGSALSYPLNVGGRPLIAVPSLMVVTFLFGIVGAALTAVLTLLIISRLPRLYHPLFGAQAFERASDDGFFLFIDAGDPLFDKQATRAWLAERAISVQEVQP
jgi:hypothetical protein